MNKDVTVLEDRLGEGTSDLSFLPGFGGVGVGDAGWMGRKIVRSTLRPQEVSRAHSLPRAMAFWRRGMGISCGAKQINVLMIGSASPPVADLCPF